jgi:hypothetical protein
MDRPDVVDTVGTRPELQWLNTIPIWAVGSGAPLDPDWAVPLLLGTAPLCCSSTHHHGSVTDAGATGTDLVAGACGVGTLTVDGLLGGAINSTLAPAIATPVVTNGRTDNHDCRKLAAPASVVVSAVLLVVFALSRVINRMLRSKRTARYQVFT